MGSPSAANMAERIAGSIALAAVSRIGVPLLLGVVTYGATVLIDMERRVMVLEQARLDAATSIAQRLSVLEAEDARVRERDAQLRADLAAVKEGQVALLRALGRVESSLDRAHARP